MSVNLSEFVSGFLAEAADHLRSINANLLLVDAAIQKRTPNPRAVRELFRSLHTMKGLAGMVGVEPIVDLAHAMERVLREAEQHGGKMPGQAFEPLLEGTNAIAQRIDALAAGRPVAEAPKELLTALDGVDVSTSADTRSRLTLALEPSLKSKLNASDLEQLSSLSAGRSAYRLCFTPSATRAAEGMTITSVRERLAALAEIVKVVPVAAKELGGLNFVFLVVSDVAPATLAQVVGCPPEQVVPMAHEVPGPLPVATSVPDVIASEETHGSSAASVVRVDVRRVDAAMDGLGELLVTKFRLLRALETLRAAGADVRELNEVAEDLQRRLRDVRALVLGMRMISLSELLDRLPILVRGLQATTGKATQVRLEVGRFEVDKAVGERLWPVLVHLVRNAVDHGIEAEAGRIAAGKPPRGTILVSCVKSSNSRLELTIEDDGCGVDAVQVAQRAGLPVPNDDEALLDLIARPGLSTRATADATSGRGMGLDIARRIVVDELGGAMRLRSTPGTGTCFVLDVPITVAVVDAFRCQSASDAFLVPVSSVEEFVDVEPGDLVGTPVINQAGVSAALLSRRGRAMPFVELSRLLGGKETQATSRKAIIVRRNEQYFAFGVDRLLDQHEVIIRRLADPLVDVEGVSGAADLGDGRPTLLLDLVALSRSCGQAERAA